MAGPTIPREKPAVGKRPVILGVISIRIILRAVTSNQMDGLAAEGRRGRLRRFSGGRLASAQVIMAQICFGAQNWQFLWN